MTLPSRRFMLLGAATLALAGCASSPPARYYRLAALPGPAHDGITPRIAVRSIEIPGYLDQTNIAQPAGTYQFSSSANALWAQPLATMLQSVMVQNLAQRLPDATIIASGGAIGAPTDILVEINLLRFDPDPSGNIQLTAQFAIRAASGQPNWQIQTFSANATPTGPTTAEAVAAMSKLWADAADQLAGRIP
jgi:uncharacterized lipoprotein YmbA